jgi:hypothetical protein
MTPELDGLELELAPESIAETAGDAAATGTSG